jgi:hypothetical protein
MELNEIEFVVLRAIYNETKDVNSKGIKGNQIFPKYVTNSDKLFEILSKFKKLNLITITDRENIKISPTGIDRVENLN